MTSIKVGDIDVFDVAVRTFNPAQLREAPSRTEQADAAQRIGISIIIHHEDFRALIGTSPTFSLLLSSLESSKNPFFYGSCVYLPTHSELYTTSKPLQASDFSRLPVILISRIKIVEKTSEKGAPTGEIDYVEWMKLRPPPAMAMPCGATNYDLADVPLSSASSTSSKASSNSGGGAGKSTKPGGILYCSQGSFTPGTGGLFYMPHNRPPQPVITSYHGRDFNSPHGVTIAPKSGLVWFTDPSSGHDQEFRPPPSLPGQVYCFDPVTGTVRAMADGFGRPTSIAFDREESVAYVADGDAWRGEATLELSRPASIYAFDIVDRSGVIFLANRRLFAYMLRGVPMEVKCDAAGNVYAACGDGIEVWSPAGTLLGVIEVPSGVTAFCFRGPGDLFLCAEQRLWRLQLAQSTSEKGPA